MHTLETRSITTLALDKHEEKTFATLLHPMRMSLMLAFFMLGGGSLIHLLSINGFVPNGRAGNVWDWASILIGGAIGLASLLGLVFVKPLALKWIMLSREMKALAARRKLSNTEINND